VVGADGAELCSLVGTAFCVGADCAGVEFGAADEAAGAACVFVGAVAWFASVCGRADGAALLAVRRGSAPTMRWRASATSRCHCVRSAALLASRVGKPAACSMNAHASGVRPLSARHALPAA